MLLYKVLRFIARPIVGFLFPTKVIGKENFFQGKSVVICNHYSQVDSLLLATKLLKNSINCVAKKELFSKPVGAIFEKVGAISVDREAPSLNTHKSIMNVLNNDQNLIIFPEGTRNKEGTEELAPLKHGAGLYAVKGKAKVVPILIHHKSRLFRRNYMIIGKPIELDVFYGKHSSSIKEEVTALLTEKMNELRQEIDMFINKKKGKKTLCS